MKTAFFLFMVPLPGMACHMICGEYIAIHLQERTENISFWWWQMAAHLRPLWILGIIS